MNPLLPWWHQAWGEIRQCRDTNRFPHALLLSGPMGLGKDRFSETLVQALLCTAPGPDGVACNHCRSCELYQAHTHPDRHVVFPDEEGKPITIDQIREVGYYLTFTPQYGQRKAVIIKSAEQMNVHAYNSLLKNLEEPPAYGVLLLITAKPSRLPKTVLSRCRSLRLVPPPREEALAWLATQVSDEDWDFELLLDLTDGAPLAALRLVQEGRLPERMTVFEHLEGLARRDIPITLCAEHLLKLGAKQTLYWWYSIGVDLVRLRMLNNTAAILNKDLKERLTALISGLNTVLLHRHMEDILRAIRWVSSSPINSQLLLEELSMAWQGLWKK